MQEQLNELESQLAFQEHTIATLNEAVTRQQQQIDLLEDKVRHLSAQLRQVAESLSRKADDEPPPPHY